MNTLRYTTIMVCCGLFLAFFQTSPLAGAESGLAINASNASIEQLPILSPSQEDMIFSPQQAMDTTIVLPFRGYEAWMLIEPLNYRIGSTNATITVPAGFVTDYASVPKAFWNVFSKVGVYSEAAIIHDYLYWVHMCTKEQADNIFLIAMKEHDTDFLTRTSLYSAVSLAGQSSWDHNKDAREKGAIRTVPKDYWNEVRQNGFLDVHKKLMKRGVKESYPQIPDEVCRIGNSKVVP